MTIWWQFNDIFISFQTISVPAIPSWGLDGPSFFRDCVVPYLGYNLACDPSATTGGDTVCTEQNYGRENPNGKTCCCKEEFCNGPIAPTWVPTTTKETIITSENSFGTTKNMIEVTSEPVTMETDQHDMSTHFFDYSTEEGSGASRFTLHLFICLLPFVFLFCTLW